MRIIAMVALLSALLIPGLVAQAPVCGTLQTVPNFENFDGAVNTTSASCTLTSPGTLPSGWALDAASTNAWRVRNTSTTSTSTGPSADHTTGTSGQGNFLFTETSGTCPPTGLPTADAILNSPCYDVGSLPNGPVVDFWYHMWGADIGTLSLESWDGTQWVQVWTLSGDQGNQWNNAVVPVLTYMDGGNMVSAVRFFAQHFSGASFNGDIAIDDVFVRDSMPAIEYGTNLPYFELTVDDTVGNEFFPATVAKDVFPSCTGETVDFTVRAQSDTPGALYDIAVSSSPVVPGASSPFTIGGIIFNLDIANYAFITGGLLPDFLSMPGIGIPGAGASSWEVPLQFTTGGTVTLQGITLDPSQPLNVGCSQPTQIDRVAQPLATSIAGPTSVSTNLNVALDQGATCWAPGGMPFYGTIFNDIWVSPNGFVAFGGSDTDGSPSITDMLNDDGRFGFWTDLDPSEGGTIDITNPAAGVIRIDWSGVFYNTGGPGTTFGLTLDSNTGVFTLDGLQSMVANPNTSSTLDDQWMGISPGISIAGLTATDPGAVAFTAGTGGGAANPGDALYEFNDVSVSLTGLPASVVAGANSITFIPDGAGNYTWTAN